MGFVKYADQTILGEKEADAIQFDPGVFIDEENQIYLYSGNGPRRMEDTQNKASQVMQLEEDMLTLKVPPQTLLPSILNSKGTGFEGHEFFEASSMRKIGDTYFLIYSSVNSHELCYAISNAPDKNFQYGGTLISIGDVFLDGKTAKEAVNYLGNTHGSIEYINGQWYVFYHRQTNGTQYSRQACAELIEIVGDRIKQVEITSCGLNKGPLKGEGYYDAAIACHLTGPNGATFSHPMAMKDTSPFITQEGEDREHSPNQYVKNVVEGTLEIGRASCRERVYVLV